MQEEIIGKDKILPGPPDGYVAPYSKLTLPLGEMKLWERLMVPKVDSVRGHLAMLRRYRHAVGKYNKLHKETRFETKQMEDGNFYVQRTK